MQSLIKLLRELSRRKVTRVAAGYIVVVWVLSLGFAELFPVFGLGDWAVRGFILVGLLGLPVAILLSWKYNLTIEGVVRDPMDFPSPPLTPGKIREWCMRRQNEAIPIPLIAYWDDPEQRPQKQRFAEAILIGREAVNDISIADQRVSRMHAVAWYEGTSWRLRDLASSNGSYVNGERLQGEMRLPPICEFRMHPKGPLIRFETSDDDQTLLTLHSYTPDNAEGQE